MSNRGFYKIVIEPSVGLLQELLHICYKNLYGFITRDFAYMIFTTKKYNGGLHDSLALKINWKYFSLRYLMQAHLKCTSNLASTKKK